MKFFGLIIFLFTIIIVGSCSLKNTNTTPPAAAILFAQLSPNSPNVDIYINSSLFVSNVGYGNYIPYSTLAPGSYQIEVTPTGSNNTVLYNSTINIASDNFYSFFTTDSVSKMQSALVQDTLRAPGADTALFRILDFCPDTIHVDFALSTGSILYADRGFNDQSINPAYTKFYPLVAGKYTFNAFKTGTDTLLTQIDSMQLNGGKIYTLYLKGFAAGTGGYSLGIGTILHN